MDSYILEQDGYVGIIKYIPDPLGSIAKSKQYQLIINKDGKICINRYGLTLGGAKSKLYTWVKKQATK